MKLFAANSTPIQVYGESLYTLDPGLRRAFLWNFVIADVDTAIIGADFLQHFHRLVDLRDKSLVDALTNLRTPGSWGANRKGMRFDLANRHLVEGVPWVDCTDRAWNAPAIRRHAPHRDYWTTDLRPSA